MKKIIRYHLLVLSFMALLLAFVMTQTKSVHAYNPLDDIDYTDVDKTNTETGYRYLLHHG